MVNWLFIPVDNVFLKFFSDQENELKQFFKEQKIDLKVPEDLITLVK